MSWPTPQDYNEAIQLPQVCFADAELQAAHPQLTALGLPKPNSGAFASVYKMSCGERHWAVRCFLRNVANQQDRYRKISDFILSDELPYTVDFAYLEQGINIRGTWYPILKMDWVDGRTLDSFVLAHINDRATLDKLVTDFRQMHADLQRNGIAHGDLQHGNIIITAEGDLRLVDYDGMFVPALEGETSNELGHPNYQHPQRTGRHFDASLDNFSCWVIETSLRTLASDPSLASRFNACDDALLFRRNDFLYPADSPAFYFLERHTNDQVQKYSRWLRVQVQSDLVSISEPPDTLESPPPLPAQLAVDPSSRWYSDSRPEQGIDWEQLKQFYNVGNLPRLLANNREEELSSPLVTFRKELYRGRQARFGVEYLQSNFEASTPAWVWLLTGMALLFTFNVSLLIFVPCLVFALGFGLKTAELNHLYKRAGEIVKDQLPVDVVIEFRKNEYTTTVKIIRTPPGNYSLRGRKCSFRGDRRLFHARYGDEGSTRVLMFADQLTAQPIAMIHDLGVSWFI